MSIGFSFSYYKSIRNPVLRRMSDLGAVCVESATTIETILESDRVSRGAVNQFLTLEYISTSENGGLYLNVRRIRQMARRTGLLFFLITESILITILWLLLFGPTVIEVPPLLVWSLLIGGEISIVLLTYLEGWPFFYLRHSVK